MTPLATVVDVSALAQTALAALVGGVGVTFLFSLAILGGTRFGDLRKEGRGAAAYGALALAGFGLAASALGIAIGIAVMVGK